MGRKAPFNGLEVLSCELDDVGGLRSEDLLEKVSQNLLKPLGHWEGVEVLARHALLSVLNKRISQYLFFIIISKQPVAWRSATNAPTT